MCHPCSDQIFDGHEGDVLVLRLRGPNAQCGALVVRRVLKRSGPVVAAVEQRGDCDVKLRVIGARRVDDSKGR
eukprot:387129-Pleurochrysis_carterae.AAC.1